jgi:hypothetical protein
MENIVCVKDWDRTLAFLIIEGKIYESGNNHQDCLLDYLTDIGDEAGIRLSEDEDAYDEVFDELLDRTHNVNYPHLTPTAFEVGTCNCPEVRTS